MVHANNSANTVAQAHRHRGSKYRNDDNVALGDEVFTWENLHRLAIEMPIELGVGASELTKSNSMFNDLSLPGDTPCAQSTSPHGWHAQSSRSGLRKTNRQAAATSPYARVFCFGSVCRSRSSRCGKNHIQPRLNAPVGIQQVDLAKLNKCL
jgi:hypothetical protein